MTQNQEHLNDRKKVKVTARKIQFIINREQLPEKNCLSKDVAMVT